MGATITNLVHRQMIKDIVARRITCEVTGEVLDHRTCVVLLNRVGDPVMVLSQKGWKLTLEQGVDRDLAAMAVTVDPFTVKS